MVVESVVESVLVPVVVVSDVTVVVVVVSVGMVSPSGSWISYRVELVSSVSTAAWRRTPARTSHRPYVAPCLRPVN